jgi:hypothetical protein
MRRALVPDAQLEYNLWMPDALDIELQALTERLAEELDLPSGDVLSWRLRNKEALKAELAAHNARRSQNTRVSLVGHVIDSALDAGFAGRDDGAEEAVARLGSRNPELIDLWRELAKAARIWKSERPAVGRRGTAWSDLRRAGIEAARVDLPRTYDEARKAADRLGVAGRAPVRLWMAWDLAETLLRESR